VQEATSVAIVRAKENGAEEVTADDLLLGCLKVISRFGVVEIGTAIIDLESLGVDWLRQTQQARGKVSYSQGVVDILDRAALIAKRDESAKVGIDHLLAAFASEKCGVMMQLRRIYGISSASWRAAVSGFRQPETAKPISAQPEAATVPVREYLSPEEAAIELGIHVQTLRAYVRSGKLPALRLAGERAIRIRREDLHNLLEPFQPES
jgi:excisionase family DNA binding protein